MLSLATNPACLLVDDELNILPTSTYAKTIEPISLNPDGAPVVTEAGSSAQAATELKELGESLAETQVSVF